MAERMMKYQISSLSGSDPNAGENAREPIPILPVFSLLPHEGKLSVLNFNLCRYHEPVSVSRDMTTATGSSVRGSQGDQNLVHGGNSLTDEDIIQSKDELVFMVSIPQRLWSAHLISSALVRGQFLHRARKVLFVVQRIYTYTHKVDNRIRLSVFKAPSNSFDILTTLACAMSFSGWFPRLYWETSI